MTLFITYILLTKSLLSLLKKVSKWMALNFNKRNVLRRESRDTNGNIKWSVYCQYGGYSLTFQALALRQRETNLYSIYLNLYTPRPTQPRTHGFYSALAYSIKTLGTRLRPTLAPGPFARRRARVRPNHRIITYRMRALSRDRGPIWQKILPL